MKTVADYIKLVEDGEASTNTISSGAIATKDVPLGKIQKRKKVAEDVQLDEAKKKIATYRNKIGVLSQIFHNTQSGKYLVKHFLNGSHHHGHDSVHDTEEEAHAAATSKVPKGQSVKESQAYEGENPLAKNAGGVPLAGVVAPDTEPESDEARMFRQKQAAQQNYS